MSGWLSIHLKPKDAEWSTELCAYSRSSPEYELFWENLRCDRKYSSENSVENYYCLTEEDIYLLISENKAEIKSWEEYIKCRKREKDEGWYISVRESLKSLEEQKRIAGMLDFLLRCTENNELYCYTT